jgi:hypothetical protein
MKTIEEQLIDLVDKYTKELAVLVKKTAEQGHTDFRDGVMGDIKEVINDLTTILSGREAEVTCGRD